MRQAVSRIVLAALAVLVIGFFGYLTWAGTARPRAQLAGKVDLVGKATPLEVDLSAGRTGLSSYSVALRGPDGQEKVLATKDYPRSGLFGSGVSSEKVDLTLDAQSNGLSEGPAEILVYAEDYSPAAMFRSRAPLLTQPVRVDLTPPRVAPIEAPHTVRDGGTDLVIYQVDADVVESGVEVGNSFFPGVAAATGQPNVRIVLYPVPHDPVVTAQPRVIARDAAGNETSETLHIKRERRNFPREEIRLSDDFLGRKVPDLLAANQMPAQGSLLDSYLLINRELRDKSEKKIRELLSKPGEIAYLQGPFLRQPKSKVASSFASHRTYRYNDKVVDEQLHLGYDLASLKNAPVIATNAGVVRFVGPLGIYGNTIVIDHGLGIASLYAHLSQANVAVGQEVVKEDVIGHSGETGLAGGDHLHFSILVGGVHVDPVEWWDPQWIRTHFEQPLANAQIALATHTPTRTAATSPESAGATAPAGATAAGTAAAPAAASGAAAKAGAGAPHAVPSAGAAEAMLQGAAALPGPTAVRRPAP